MMKFRTAVLLLTAAQCVPGAVLAADDYPPFFPESATAPGQAVPAPAPVQSPSAQFPQASQTTQVSPVAGTWRKAVPGENIVFQLNPDGTFALFNNNQLKNKGYYRTEGSVIMFMDTPGGAPSFSWQFVINGNRLTLLLSNTDSLEFIRDGAPAAGGQNFPVPSYPAPAQGQGGIQNYPAPAQGSGSPQVISPQVIAPQVTQPAPQGPAQYTVGTYQCPHPMLGNKNVYWEFVNDSYTAYFSHPLNNTRITIEMGSYKIFGHQMHMSVHHSMAPDKIGTNYVLPVTFNSTGFIYTDTDTVRNISYTINCTRIK